MQGEWSWAWALLALPLWHFLLISPWPLSLCQRMGSSGPARGGMALTGDRRGIPWVHLGSPTVFLACPYFSQTTQGGFCELEEGPGLILKPLHLPPRAWLWLLAFLGIRAGEGKQVLTIVTSPVDVDASAIVAGKLSQGEAGGISCQGERVAE